MTRRLDTERVGAAGTRRPLRPRRPVAESWTARAACRRGPNRRTVPRRRGRGEGHVTDTWRGPEFSVEASSRTTGSGRRCPVTGHGRLGLGTHPGRDQRRIHPAVAGGVRRVPGRSSPMDGIVNVLQFAVDGVAQQQQATANNLANGETPGLHRPGRQLRDQPAAGHRRQRWWDGQRQRSPPTPPRRPRTATTSTPVRSSSTARRRRCSTRPMVEMLNAQFRLISGAAGGSFS